MIARAKLNRNHAIDVLKGVAILFIIITHFQWSELERLKMGFPFWIDMAVTTFMVISGFLYARSFESKGIDTFEKAYKPKLIVEKMLRFTIPFAIAFLVEAVYIITMVPNTHNMVLVFLQGGIGAGSYYYPIMMQFIFLFPIIFFVIRKYLFKGLLICLGMNAVYEVLHWAYGMNEQCYRLIALRYIFVIAFGVFLHFKNCCEEETKIHYKKFLAAIFVLGTLFIGLTCYTSYQPKIIIHWTRVSFMGSMYFLPIMDWLIDNCRIKCKPLELLGQGSFNIFLTQMIFYWLGAPLIYSCVSNRMLQLMICSIICIVIGMLFYFIEQPITKWVVKQIKNL